MLEEDILPELLDTFELPAPLELLTLLELLELLKPLKLLELLLGKELELL